jgi:hypothetical protein
MDPFDGWGVERGWTQLLWQDSVKRIVLAKYYTWRQSGRIDLIVLFARSRAADDVMRRKVDAENQCAALYGVEALRREICDSLRSKRTPFDRLCKSTTTPKDPLAELIACGLFVAAETRNRDSANLLLYRMAIYAFGNTYAPPWKWTDSIARDIDTLGKFNVVFQYSHLGESWVYSHSPIIKICDEYPRSYWGQWAFVIMQNLGWCPDGMCNGNQGPLVISKGEDFLHRYPENRFTSEVLLTIAKGHESDWNVSTCDPQQSEYMYDEGNRNDQSSRLKSIAVYERILKEYPDSPEAGVAKARLPRLKLGINTNTRDFMFIYD